MYSSERCGTGAWELIIVLRASAPRLRRCIICEPSSQWTIEWNSHFIISMIFLVVECGFEFGNEDLYLFQFPEQYLGEQKQCPALTALETVVVIPLTDLLHQLQVQYC